MPHGARVVFSYIPEKPFIDFGFDILPKIVGGMKGYVVNEYIIEVENMRSYNKAQEERDKLAEGALQAFACCTTLRCLKNRSSD